MRHSLTSLLVLTALGMGAACTLASAGGTGGLTASQVLVSDFGAVADDGIDDTEAVVNAIAAAMDLGGAASVRFGPGTYHFEGATSGRHHVVVENAVGLTLQGDKTELMFRNPQKAGINFQSCQDCALKGFTLDYETPPFTQGTIAAVNSAKGFIDLQLDAGYPSLTSEWFATTDQVWGSARDRATHRLREDAPDHFFPQDLAEVSPGLGLFRITMREGYRPGLRFLKPGDAMAFVARQSGAAAEASLSDRILFEDLTVHASTTCGVVLYASSSCVVRRLVVGVRPGSTRLISANADGVHCQQARVGPIVEDCAFSSLMDDGVAIYTVPNIVTEVVSERELVAIGGCLLQDGDILEAWDPVTGALRGTSAIESVSSAGNRHDILLVSPIKGLVAGADSRKADHLYNRNACGEGFVIRRNTIENNRRHGIYIKSGNGVIEGNTIREVSGLGIVIANEPTWPEGPISRNIVIRGNTVDSVGYSGSYGLQADAAAIQVKATTVSGKISQFRHSSVTIASNTITNWPKQAIYLGGVSGATLVTNAITSGLTPRYPAKGWYAVYVEQSDNVSVDALTVVDSRPLKAALFLGRTVPKASVNMTGVTLNGVEGGPAVVDYSR